MLEIKSIEAIDVHAHFGEYNSSLNELKNRFMTADTERMSYYAGLANIRYSIVSPYSAILPRGGGNPTAGNISGERLIDQTDNFLLWAVVDPLKPETYIQAEKMLRNPKCVGIKIHPEEHCYPIKKYGREIYEFAARQNAVIESHSGEQNSMPEDFVQFADEYPMVKTIVSHLGCGWDGDPCHQVRAIQKCRKDNLFTDTSSSLSIMPQILEWAVQEIGADRILFGTDSPGYFAPMQRARVDYADICEEDKEKILCGNAKQLFMFFRKV